MYQGIKKVWFRTARQTWTVFQIGEKNLIKGSFNLFHACHKKVTAPAYLNVELRKIKSLSKTPNNKQNVSPREKRKFPIFTGPTAKLCSDWKTRESPPPTENSLTNSTFSQKKWTKCC